MRDLMKKRALFVGALAGAVFLALFRLAQAHPDEPKVQTYYEILGVSQSASHDEIKKRYRKRLSDTHPDRNPPERAEEAASEFRAVFEAGEVLLNERSRAQYDRRGAFTSGFLDERPATSGGSRGPSSYDLAFNEVLRASNFPGADFPDVVRAIYVKYAHQWAARGGDAHPKPIIDDPIRLFYYRFALNCVGREVDPSLGGRMPKSLAHIAVRVGFDLLLHKASPEVRLEFLNTVKNFRQDGESRRPWGGERERTLAKIGWEAMVAMVDSEILERGAPSCRLLWGT